MSNKTGFKTSNIQIVVNRVESFLKEYQMYQSRYLQHLIVIFLVTLATTPALSSASEMILKDFNGEFTSLNKHINKGKWTIVMLWASDCHVCNQEVGEYMAFHSKHKKTDATVLGISLDGDSKKSDAQDFLVKHKVNFPSLIGEPDFVANGFMDITGTDFRGTPTFMIYGPDGKIRAQQAGAVPVAMIEAFMKGEN